jgi:hypothetical protein
VQVIEMRFGPVPAELRPAVTALVERGDRLAVFMKALTAPSLAELLAEQ